VGVLQEVGFAMPKLLITKGPERGRVLRIASDAPPTVGRQNADIVIDDSYISKKHARFFMKDDRWYIEDLGSGNGTYINGKRITEPVKLRRGDRVQIGQTKMVVSPQTPRKESKKTDATQKPEPIIDFDSPSEPTDEQKVETDSLDASSLLMDVLGDMTVDEVDADVDDDDDDDIDDYIPDYDPTDPSTHRSRKKKKSDVDRTAVPEAKKDTDDKSKK
jgi:pSer/pThr/pTyr-binding forkhead associated (FHA) protein